MTYNELCYGDTFKSHFSCREFVKLHTGFVSLGDDVPCGCKFFPLRQLTCLDLVHAGPVRMAAQNRLLAAQRRMWRGRFD